MKVSVCMATYNGAKYVRDQLASILAQLEPGDEVVVVDDASSDATVEIVESLGDPRIRLLRQPHNQGYVRTFERALREAEGDVLLLADQDDVWVPARRDALVAALTDTAVAASNLVVLGSGAPLANPVTGRPWRLHARTSEQHARNIARILMGIAPYYGCAMGMRAEFRSLALPFPEYLTESHDLWLAILANRAHAMRHVEANTVQRRFHDENSSSPRPRSLRLVLRARVMLLRLTREAGRRMRGERQRAKM
jgi:glycosyltransferase involved in cell wall biosynthesis